MYKYVWIHELKQKIKNLGYQHNRFAWGPSFCHFSCWSFPISVNAEHKKSPVRVKSRSTSKQGSVEWKESALKTALANILCLPVVVHSPLLLSRLHCRTGKTHPEFRQKREGSSCSQLVKISKLTAQPRSRLSLSAPAQTWTGSGWSSWPCECPVRLLWCRAECWPVPISKNAPLLGSRLSSGKYVLQNHLQLSCCWTKAESRQTGKPCPVVCSWIPALFWDKTKLGASNTHP